MGILWVMPTWPGPSELWMTRTLDTLGHHLQVIACGNPAETSWRGHGRTLNLYAQPSRLQRLTRRLGRVTNATQRLARASQQTDVDLLYVNYVNAALNLEPVWQTCDKPLFVHCHGRDVTWQHRGHGIHAKPSFPSDYLDRVTRMAERATFIANSRHTAARLTAAGIPPEQIKTWYFGVPEQQQEPRRNQRCHILFLGRLVDFKGPDLTIQAFELACQRGLEADLTIAGDGPLGSMCALMQKRSAFSDRIHLLGAVTPEQGEALRASADIFTAHSCTGALSGQEEAFGVSFAEAMAAGLPVVTGRNGSLPELLDNERGVLFQPGDVAAQADAFLRLAQDPELRESLGQQARTFAQTNFDPEANAKALLDLLGLKP